MDLPAFYLAAGAARSPEVARVAPGNDWVAGVTRVRPSAASCDVWLVAREPARQTDHRPAKGRAVVFAAEPVWMGYWWPLRVMVQLHQYSTLLRQGVVEIN